VTLSGWPGPCRAEKVGRNEAACRAWCEKRSECVQCSEHRGCGPGFRRIKGWTGKGRNWYACAASEVKEESYILGSARNQKACQEWCERKPECVKCSERRRCGPGFKRIKRFAGRGRNWYACTESR
jgi:hypothetical protein